MSTHDEWLNQIQEEAIEPDRPICDPHHHLWDQPGNRYLLDELMAEPVNRACGHARTKRLRHARAFPS